MRSVFVFPAGCVMSLVFPLGGGMTPSPQIWSVSPTAGMSVIEPASSPDHVLVVRPLGTHQCYVFVL